MILTFASTFLFQHLLLLKKISPYRPRICLLRISSLHVASSEL